MALVGRIKLEGELSCLHMCSAQVSGSSVAQLKATDPEGEPLIYGVSGEEAMRYFSVNKDTGVVWLRQQLDRETKSEMQVEFYVSDIQEVVKDTVNIQIGDVNDNAPNFHGQPYTVRIPESTAVGTSIFMVNATDPDQGTGGSILFSFQPPSPFFAIDGARGTVTVTRPLDYERTSAYQLTVNATDQDKLRPLSRLANMAITITDVQDMDPVFTNLPYSTNIEEGVSLVSTIIQISNASIYHGPLLPTAQHQCFLCWLLYKKVMPNPTVIQTQLWGYEVRKIVAIDQDRGQPRGIGYTIVSASPLLAPSVLGESRSLLRDSSH
ncbi:cadherin-23-like [Cyprinodon tularosa]|uniref:cadherin-23-like n=1 Tax=Cyprinodon tularosa TaxID=77115 RepID=UPI0018E21A49|nr:cadherin-23-like [Cyprinodon tularosa]